ncbi:hypothetical protein [Membranihabitans marinus]|uniref:hypothetical protein n=1 Tax=Membranihabitans marinus TaxID=1227546 RepID=UPI001F317B9A|nr:hypothetical protein [Membranihabitans marinus]
MKELFITFFMVIYLAPFAHSQSIAQKYDSENKTGDLYLYWGWNRGWFTTSDIHFRGQDYDFTLSNVEAFDRQSSFEVDKYLNPQNATIPQYNFRAGYFINPKINLTFGIDHMKYVVRQNQLVNINGHIEGTETLYNRDYANEMIQITDDFLKFEHTDGLNYVNFGVRRQDKLLSVGPVGLDALIGVEGGFLLPRTNSTLLSMERNDAFHLAGYGASGVVGLQISIFRNFFIQSEVKGGYINLPDIRTTMSSIDKADQQFLFGQLNILFGGTLHLGH